MWDLDSGAPLHTLAGHHRGGPPRGVAAVAVSADGRRAVSGGDDGTVRVWDLATGKQIASASQRLWHWFARLHRRSVRSLSVSADGRCAVSGGDDGTVRVWDLDSGAPLHTLAGHQPTAGWAVAVSADGRRAVSGGRYDGTVRVWDLDSGAPLHTLAGHHRGVAAVAVSADGRRAVSGGEVDGTVRVWDLEQGVALASFASDSDPG